MRRHNTFKIIIVLLIGLPCCFQSCLKDKCKSLRTYTYFVPVYKTKDEVRANIKSNAPQPIENPGKINVLGHTIFLNEIDKGIHIIDNSDPAQPKNIAFISIPGNMDMAVKGNMLYADLYTDLVTIDISDPAHVRVKNIIDNLFPYRVYDNGFVASHDNIITDWARKDTTVTENCDQSGRLVFADPRDVFLAGSSSSPGGTPKFSPVGVGGSTARFTIMNDRLYTVGNSDLTVLNITAPAAPAQVNHINVGWNIETIYPFKDKLFIGSVAGMFIFNVSNPDEPFNTGQFAHARCCDPVIADNNYAYVTLSSGSFCQGFTNELDIVKLNNFVSPSLQKVYLMTNPHGLSKDGDLLFICDGSAGLKLYNTSDVMNLQPIKTISDMDASDVIAYDNWALVVAKDGLYQYDYTNPSDIHFLSKLSIGK